MTLLRIWKYTKRYRKHMILSLTALIFVVILDLLIPFITKTLIDEYIVGIEQPWYEVKNPIENSVAYRENYYIQERYMDESDKDLLEESREVRILLLSNKYYFINEHIEEGAKKVKGDQLLVEAKGTTLTYDLIELSTTQVFNFYQPSVFPVIRLLIAFVVISVLAIFTTYYYRIKFMQLGTKVTYDLRQEAFEKLQKLHISYYDRIPAGKIVARVTNDTETIIDLFSRSLIVFTQAFIYFIGIYFSLFLLDVRLASASLILLPLLFIWGKYYRKGAKRNNEVIRSENSEINAYLNQSIKGMEIIQAFNREEMSFDEFQKHNNRYLEYKNKMLILNGTLSGNMVRVFQRIIQISILLYFGWGALGFHTIIAVGVIYAFIEYMNKLINPINQIFGNIEVLEQSLVSANRVFHLLDQDEIELYDDHITRFRGEIEFRDLSFAYEENNYVLKDINLAIKAGETIAIVGHTGSGKSSLMNVLLRFYDYEEGEILIDGMDIRNYTKQAFRKHVGIVLQDPVLFTGTIASNIRLNNEKVTDEIIEKALNEIGADQFVNRFNKGIHEPVLEMGSNFSVGERQLISFARAMIYDPAVLVLDEATANIDTETEQLIQKALQVVKENRTTFIIAHRLSTIKDADQIVVLDKGRVLEKGSHDALMSLGGKYYEMYQSQLVQI
jgi:ATP-binding cassette, subfamily B, multidrug efflux pump